MQQIIKKWGNGAAVRLPVAVMNEAQLSVDEAIDVRVEDGRIVIEAARPRYTLDELLAQCDSSAEFTAEDREWLEARPLGNELL